MNLDVGSSASNNNPTANGNEISQATANQAAPPSAVYSAFISYNHAADGSLAPALRDGLQRFATPWGVFRLINPVRSLRIFQDQASLSANPALWPTIEQALAAAEWFILLASPEAAASPWVGKEVDFWRRNRTVETLLIVQTDGEVAWDEEAGDFDWARTTALPEQLARVYPHEPRWIDARWARTAAQTTLRDPRFRDLVAELAAPLRGMAKDELIGEDIRQHRRLNRWRNIGFGVVTTLLIGATTAAVIAVRQRDEALRNQSKALALIADTERQRGASTVGVRIALAGLPSAVASPDRPYVPETEAALYRSLQEDRVIRRLTGHSGSLRSAAFSPDGRRAVTSSSDGTVRVWDVTTGKELAGWSVFAPRSARFSPDGRRIAVACLDGNTRVLDAVTGEQIAVLSGHGSIVQSAAFSPDGTKIVTASLDHTARLWNASTGEEIAVLRGHQDMVQSAAFSPDGSRIATAGSDGTVRLWNAANGKQLAILHNKIVGESSDIALSTAAFSPDGKKLVTSGPVARLWDAETGEELATLSGHEALIWSAEFSRDGRRIVTASKDTTVRIWDAETAKELALFRGHDSDAFSATFAPDGRTILTTGKNDATAWLWNAAPSEEVLVLRGQGKGVGPTGTISAAFSPDGRQLVTASSDARLWDVGTGRQLLVFDHEDEITFTFFSSDGQTVTTWSRDGAARRWDVVTGKLIERFSAYDGAVRSAAVGKGLSADLSRLADITPDGIVRLWGITERYAMGTFHAEDDKLVIGVSSDGRMLATFGSDSTAERVALWETKAGSQVGLLRGHTGVVLSAAFSSDGRRVATAGGDSTVRLWDIATSQERMMLQGHAGMVLGVAFSPDGKTIASGAADKTARLWDAETGQQLKVLSGHEDLVLSVRFSPDGRSVVTTSADQTARIWPVLPRGQALIELACARVPWPLSADRQQRFGISEEWCTPEVSAALRAKLGLGSSAVDIPHPPVDDNNELPTSNRLNFIRNAEVSKGAFAPSNP